MWAMQKVFSKFSCQFQTAFGGGSVMMWDSISPNGNIRPVINGYDLNAENIETVFCHQWQD